MIDVIYDSFIAPLYQRLFREEPPRRPKRAMESIIKVVHWFLIQKSTFIIVFGSYKASYDIPRFARDNMLLGEVFY